MTATIKLVALTAIRDRLLAGVALLLLGASCLSLFLGGTAVTEQLPATVVFAAGTGRLVLVLGLTVFAAFHVQALFETREIEAILSRALSRGQFVLSYWIALSLLAILIAGVFGLALSATLGFSLGALLWTATLMAECVIVLAVALFAGLMLERATATVLFTLGFYALARLMGFFVGIRDTVEHSAAMTIVQRGLDVVLLFVPRLDLFAQSRWLVRGFTPTTAAFVGTEAVLFVALVLTAAIFDLRRKQF